MSRVKLHNVFQDRSAFKNAVLVFVIVSLEHVVSSLGITCENSTLWLVVPPCVIFVVSCLKCKNFKLLLNCNTSKTCSFGVEFAAHSYIALMYMYNLPALTWIVAVFIDTKIWVCHRMGFKECGALLNCTLEEEEIRFHEEKRIFKAGSQNIALLILTGSVLCTAVLSWGYHLLFARPEKEHEIEDLARDVVRTVLENYAIERAHLRLQEIKAMVTAKTKAKEELKESRRENAEERLSVSCSRCEESLLLQESKWFQQLDRNIVLHLEEHLITDNVKIFYPEI